MYKIYCIGDSLTLGYPFLESDSWSGYLSEQGYEIINLGVNGESSREILNRVMKNKYFDDDKTKMVSQKSQKDDSDRVIKIATIMAGSNDFIFGEKNYLITLTNILQLAIECRKENIEPVILIPMLCNPKEAREHWIDGSGIDYEKTNELLLELRKELILACSDTRFQIKYFDVQEVYKSCNDFVDGLHPTKEGYRFLGKQIHSFLEDIRKNF